MHDWKYYDDNQIYLIDGEPRQKLKITGTRFATILGYNSWSTPFEAWCEITKTAKVPFEPTIYTEAGKAIEPKVIEFCKKKISPHVKSPQEWFGNIYENVKYDFFPNQKIFGGMWDAIVTNTNGDKIRSIIEIKTTKRSEDWVNNPPVYYLLQACLYAYLVGVDQVIMTVTILKDEDYAHPENYIVSDSNTTIYIYSLSELRFNDMTFDQLITKALLWYDSYIKSAISPCFDEHKDAEILKILRTAKPDNDLDLDHMIHLLNQKESELKRIKEENNIDVLEKDIKSLKDAVKKEFTAKMGDSDKLVYGGWSLTRGKAKETADVEKLRLDGLDRYIKVTEGSLTLRKENKGQ